MVLVTMEIPQLRVDTVVDGSSGIPPVASHGVQCPVVQGVLVVDIPVVVQRPVPVPLSVQVVLALPVVVTTGAHGSDSAEFVEDPQVQFLRLWTSL